MWQQIWGKALLWVSGCSGSVSPEENLNDSLTQSWGLCLLCCGSWAWLGGPMCLAHSFGSIRVSPSVPLGNWGGKA